MRYPTDDEIRQGYTESGVKLPRGSKKRPSTYKPKKKNLNIKEKVKQIVKRKG